MARAELRAEMEGGVVLAGPEYRGKAGDHEVSMVQSVFVLKNQRGPLSFCLFIVSVLRG